MDWRKKDLLSIEELKREEIELLLNTGKHFKTVLDRSIPVVPALRGKTIFNLFFEPSTRTQTSFSIAGKRLSADMFNFSVSTSSVKKGESLLDTAYTIQAMKVDGVIVRHRYPGAAYFLSKHLKCFVVNAGDGTHAHPTQALLDGLTVMDYFGKIEGLKIAIVGDILHSRVARSNIFLFKKLGATVYLVGPPTLLPLYIKNMDVEIVYNIDEIIEEVDIVYLLRIQFERQIAGFFPSIREYIKLYSLTGERKKNMKKGSVVMHPGPMNRGVEIGFEVADAEQSLILSQVKNGVAIRMAVLYLLAGGGYESID